MEIKVIGGGLAGTEAAYQIARRGSAVALYEMRPEASTPAHKTEYLAELVCSNSLKSKDLGNAHGLIKEELKRLDSLIIETAEESAIPGGKALVVDREKFAQRVTRRIEDHALIRIVREEVKDVPPGVVIIATGPLTSPDLTEKIRSLTGEENLWFFDAISPIVDGGSVDMEHAFYASRYIKEESHDYLNCPLTEREYDLFYEELIRAQRVDLREFEKTSYFEGCLPIEVMAERGRQTLLYGPMKPVGLTDKRTGKRPFAVVQLRRENAAGTMFNMVGYQTKLKYQEQERVFRLIPALKNALFLRHGSIHRNTYIHSPVALKSTLQLKGHGDIFFAGQITGVEGYVEATAMGLLAGISAHLYAHGKTFTPPPGHTCIGALLQYITTETRDFQPMNVNFGLLQGYGKREKEKAVEKALNSIELWIKDIDE
ncbi:MAG TPA: methylenetetrahydrofolate--tRNA-(uracil(54)-C(5))-methyltransferase (FADH(2)-oxidizing) TrmFO [Syntrophorhabdaceae bacterium]|nr:methylenetetrahydrofolate--tRNA-(uracil(54)-C(5))-methyltransferase (FADH(2)-oxidizing) TrmFO [Syntrophorhabdaceae bacterium]